MAAEVNAFRVRTNDFNSRRVSISQSVEAGTRPVHIIMDCCRFDEAHRSRGNRYAAAITQNPIFIEYARRYDAEQPKNPISSPLALSSAAVLLVRVQRRELGHRVLQDL